jgi:hypothetical protein
MPRRLGVFSKEDSMIVPTIGRVVLVHRGMSDQAEPAFVCYVHNERLINVGGFTKNGAAFSATSIQLVQEGDEIKNPKYYAEWMPYQKGQAAKTEALEQQLQADLNASRHTMEG